MSCALVHTSVYHWAKFSSMEVMLSTCLLFAIVSSTSFTGMFARLFYISVCSLSSRDLTVPGP